MKRIKIGILGVAAVFTIAASAAAEMRTWTSQKGTTIQADFVKVQLGRVYLKKADGKTVAIPLTALSTADQGYVKSKAPQPASAKAAAGKSATASSAGGSIIGFRYNNTGYFPKDAKPPTDFDGPSGKNLKWKAPLPNFGNASPIVVPTSSGARVFTLCDHGWPLGEGDVPSLVCHDADTGTLLWKKAIDPLDAIPAGEAKALREARNKYWYHQHEFNRCLQKARESKTVEELDAIRKKASEHGPVLGHNKPVEKCMGKPGSPKPTRGIGQNWNAAFNHPDCQRLRKEGLLGVSSWNWTGMGQAMCTPISDGGAVYVITGLRTVTKFDLDGNVKWHGYERDTPQTKFYECWLANGLHILPAGQNRLLVFEGYNQLWAYDCKAGKVVWKTPTSGSGGHVCGTPQLLRLKNSAGVEELIVMARTGHMARVRDGKALTEQLFNVNYHGPISDGKDRVWIQQVGGDGGHFHPKAGAPFDKKCAAGLRFRLEGEEIKYDKIFYDEKKPKRNLANDLGFVRGDELLSKQLHRVDGKTGEQIADRPRGFDAYNGAILAGGHFYAVPRMTTLEGAPRGAKIGHGMVNARMVVDVAKDGSSITFVGRRTVEVIEADPKDSGLREKRIAVIGRTNPGEWYSWHGAYIAPFAYKNRLYVRTFDNLYCFGK